MVNTRRTYQGPPQGRQEVVRLPGGLVRIGVVEEAPGQDRGGPGRRQPKLDQGAAVAAVKVAPAQVLALVALVVQEAVAPPRDAAGQGQRPRALGLVKEQAQVQGLVQIHRLARRQGLGEQAGLGHAGAQVFVRRGGEHAGGKENVPCHAQVAVAALGGGPGHGLEAHAPARLCQRQTIVGRRALVAHDGAGARVVASQGAAAVIRVGCLRLRPTPSQGGQNNKEGESHDVETTAACGGSGAAGPHAVVSP